MSLTPRVVCAKVVFCLLLFALRINAADDVSSLLQHGLDNVSFFDFKNGYKYFSRALRDAEPKSLEWQQATYGKAVCAHHLTPASPERMAEAEQLYRDLVHQVPDSAYAPRAMLNIGRIYELSDYYQDVIDLTKARAMYEDVLATWSSHPIASEATLRIAATYIKTQQTADVQRGIALLETWLAAHPSNEFASTMWQYLGNTYFYPLRDYTNCVACLLKADELGLTLRSSAGATYWQIAHLADKMLSNRAVAVTYYTKIITETPQSGKGYESQLALRRLGAPVPDIHIFRASTNWHRGP
jgi:tetratricopeptide (TPR) repeat protein